MAEAPSHRGSGPEYNHKMARGWESKSVELQQEQAREKTAKVSQKMTAKEAAVFREKENLRLQRQSIVHRLESTSNPRHRKLLEETLAALDQKLGGL
jgi:chemotaxis methyl-accepting protein methylase